MTFGTTTITVSYKDRWEIELFFKAIKQNLANQNIRWNLRKCLHDTDLDSTYRYVDYQVPSGKIKLWLVTVKYSCLVEVKPGCTPGFAGLDRSTILSLCQHS